MKYKLIGRASSIDLSDDVNKHLAQGWRLYGEPFPAPGTPLTIYHQAVVLDEAHPSIDRGGRSEGEKTDSCMIAFESEYGKPGQFYSFDDYPARLGIYVAGWLAAKAHKAVIPVGRDERSRAVRALRKICEEIGDNDWPDEQDLGDVLEKHCGGAT